VFLSHNHADKPQVRRLAEKLKAKGLRVWFDDWIVKPGDDIYLAVERGLETARTQVLCLSAAALGSQWVTLERSTVLFRDPTNAGRRFIPLLLSECELPDALRRYRYVDYRTEDADAFSELVSCLRPEDAESHVGYTYPDPSDKVTFETIKALEPVRGYWSSSDGIMRRDFVGKVLEEFRKGRDLRGLDVGCGYGRLIPWLLDGFCQHVTALEPDPGRLRAAKNSLDPNMATRVDFVERFVEDFAPPESFDLVVCSHLIQHVSHDHLRRILTKLRSLCGDGRIVLSTAHSTTGADRYVKAFVTADSGYGEDPVSPQEFDRLAENPRGVLPIRFFTLETLERALQAAGLQAMDHYVYHCCENSFGDLEKFCFRDTIVNAVPRLKESFGRDITVVARPAPDRIAQP
jgi:SAM-dependent methyltransferase